MLVGSDFTSLRIQTDANIDKNETSQCSIWLDCSRLHLRFRVRRLESYAG